MAVENSKIHDTCRAALKTGSIEWFAFRGCFIYLTVYCVNYSHYNGLAAGS